MGQFRRASLTVSLASLFALMACFGEQGGAEGLERRSDVVVSNLTAPGAVAVENHGPDIALRRNVVVEKRDGATWTAIDADVRLITNCDEVETGPTRVLRRGETLTVKTWNGWSCDGQCARSCRANVYLGPGEFRFAVLTADGQQRFEGSGFMLPAQGKR